jgi:hypothetical protein
VSTKVDTSGAGFRSTPSYQVQVVCERLAPALKNMAMIDAVRVRPFFAGYPCISEPTSTGFELRMVMPLGITMVSAEPVSLNQPPAGVESNDFVEMIKKDLGWHVSWLGIEG